MGEQSAVFEVGYVRDGRWAVVHQVGAKAGEVLSALAPESLDAEVLARALGVTVAKLPGRRFVSTRHGRWKPTP
ncbi:hypothetical protein [Nocardiopsis synnemataformans]|uniref:hypothetical protein n=1 Tax=Nocardiopsis synnemataformans TaxID=61305 RepID=UPI003EC00ADE